MSLVLDPPGNSHFLEITQVELFDDADCDRLIQRLSDDAWASARVSDYGSSSGAVSTDVRSALMQHVPVDESGWPMTEVLQSVSEKNEELWRFDIWGLTAHDYPSILRYEAGVMDHFVPHNDAGDANPTRKLSFSIQLTDPTTYRGGDLVFGASGVAGRGRGVMTIFPSILIHEVTPIISGSRLALVGWIHGPTFR